MHDLGSIIRDYRKRAGVSQLDLEMAIGASPGSLSRIENGIVNPTKETLLNIADVLKLDAVETAGLFDIDLSIEQFEDSLQGIRAMLSGKVVDYALGEKLTEIQNKLGYKGIAFSYFDQDLNALHLRYFSTGPAVDFAFKYILDQLSFNPQSLDNLDTYTKQCVDENRMFTGEVLSDFASPPLTKMQCKLIASTIGLKSFIALPIADENTVYGALTIARKESLASFNQNEARALEKMMKQIADMIRGLLKLLSKEELFKLNHERISRR
ncbi:MAG: Helix-turn-helix motif protein [candidate division WS6 bacterium OLB20]|uniref:Helix-turn-helix motif protein n=1 Tax=candidate division WS6 bacterium OLB20 TaxID=1617426 RepID=A0A136LYN6_9BACT|nr:MAG: Helix-turn-helix motif protein [candidate division WS6 bacterium OLB20]